MRQVARLPVPGTKVKPEGDRLLTVQDVAAHFGVPVSWVYAKAESGELPSYKLGHYRRFREDEIAEYLKGCRQGTGVGAA